RDSGALEQDADVVLLLFRDEYYNREKSEKPGVAEVIVAKNRNGAVGTVEALFRAHCSRFDDPDRLRIPAKASTESG
ncbi:MAG: hypothetical protein JO367_20035, partial [Actinobacteria bacterium]|nr:hypothetical protein [Actinomycetota bacterium]